MGYECGYNMIQLERIDIASGYVTNAMAMAHSVRWFTAIYFYMVMFNSYGKVGHQNGIKWRNMA